MTQPTIIGVGSNSTAYQPIVNNSGTTRVFTNVEIPATARLVLLQAGLDSDATGKAIGSFTYSGLSDYTVLFDIDPSPAQNVRVSRFTVLDVSKAGAMTITVTVPILNTSGVASSSTAGGILGVVCTDGFIQNLTLTQDRLMEHHKLKVFSGNSANTTLVSMAVLDHVAEGVNISETGASQIYQGASGNIRNLASQQSTVGTDNFQSIVMECDNKADDMAHAVILLSSQSDPFDGITGKLTSPIIK